MGLQLSLPQWANLVASFLPRMPFYHHCSRPILGLGLHAAVVTKTI